MQFKHPEYLWFLGLLLIPIIIHLFQLRKFKKINFSNVAMLEQVVQASRKSKSLKKWLLLLCRLALYAFVILAFAQPFLSGKLSANGTETVIYLDNSYSMQLSKDNETLLDKAKLELLTSLPREGQINLFTNDQVYRNIRYDDLKTRLLSGGYTTDQLSPKNIVLKAQSMFVTDSSARKELILISDFQQHSDHDWANYDNTNISMNAVTVTHDNDTHSNVSIDSIVVKSSIGRVEMQ